MLVDFLLLHLGVKGGYDRALVVGGVSRRVVFSGGHQKGDIPGTG